MKNLFQPLLLLIAGATQQELARQVRYLKVENEILRSKLLVGIKVTESEKNWLAQLATGSGRRSTNWCRVERFHFRCGGSRISGNSSGTRLR